MATAHSTGDFSPAHAIADELIQRVAPLAEHDDVPVTLPLFKWRNLLAEAAASAATPGTSNPTAPAKPRGPEPDEELHHRCVLAASALNALREATFPPSSLSAEQVTGLINCVGIIGFYLNEAADHYDRASVERAQAHLDQGT